jgi:hypothetical protein
METVLPTASLKKLIIHYVGSKNNLEPLHLSKKQVSLDEETLQTIGTAFLSRFKTESEYYQFQHAASLQYNEIYNYAVQAFLDGDLFNPQSENIAKHLYESSTHPRIKGGELYVCYFEGLPVEGRLCTALGLFKTENKSFFLDVAQEQENFVVQMKEGVALNKIDKGCLIVNTKKEDGFDVLLFDNQNRGEEAAYWRETFLMLSPQKNEFHQTNHFLTLTKQYITGQMEEDFGVEKSGQIELLSKSIDYFKSRESFDIEEFQTEVFGDDERIEGFRNFGSRYTEKHDFDITSNFDISAPAVKKQSRIFKSVIKLDRNFHIYVHGNTDLIEKGVDSDGRKFYKIFYVEET